MRAWAGRFGPPPAPRAMAYAAWERRRSVAGPPPGPVRSGPGSARRPPSGRWPAADTAAPRPPPSSTPRAPAPDAAPRTAARRAPSGASGGGRPAAPGPPGRRGCAGREHQVDGGLIEHAADRDLVVRHLLDLAAQRPEHRGQQRPGRRLGMDEQDTVLTHGWCSHRGVRGPGAAVPTDVPGCGRGPAGLAQVHLGPRGDDAGGGPQGDAVQKGDPVALGRAKDGAGLLFLTPAAAAPRDSAGVVFFRTTAPGSPRAGKLSPVSRGERGAWKVSDESTAGRVSGPVRVEGAG